MKRNMLYTIPMPTRSAGSALIAVCIAVIFWSIASTAGFGAELSTETIHRIDSVLTQDGAVSLQFGGNAPREFRRFFDLYPVETSPDLISWHWIGFATKTNALPAPAQLVHNLSSSVQRHFYRTATNILVSCLPPLTGPYAVGSESRLITDSTRQRQDNSPHRFMITIWYPASPAAGSRPEPYMERQIVAELNNSAGYTLVEPGFFRHSFSRAELSGAKERWPVLLYSPGFGSERHDNVYRIEEMVSHGYVVVAMDHRDAYASVLPNGALIRGEFLPGRDETELLIKAIHDRVADAKLVLREIERINAAEGSWKDRLDLLRIGAFGFSLGGTVAAELCRVDERCKAGLGMDGALFSRELLENPPSKPFLLLRADQEDVQLPDGRPDDRRLFIENMSRDAYFIRLGGTVHGSFSDAPLFFPDYEQIKGFVEHPDLFQDSGRVMQVTGTFIRAFFGTYLANESHAVLREPQGVYKEIVDFLSK